MNTCHNCKYFFRQMNNEDIFVCGYCSLKKIMIDDADNKSCENKEDKNPC